MSTRSSSCDPTTSCEQYRRRTRRDDFSSTTLASSSGNRSFLSIADELRVTILSKLSSRVAAGGTPVGLFSEQRHPVVLRLVARTTEGALSGPYEYNGRRSRFLLSSRRPRSGGKSACFSANSLGSYDLWTGLGISGSRAGSALSACGSRSGAGVRARVVDWSPGVLAQSGASRWACVCGNGRSRSRGRHERSRLRGLSGTRVARSLSGTRVARSARALEVARSLSGTRVARSARALEVARSLSGTRVARSARALGVARELSKVHNAFGATVGMPCGPALGSPGLARGLRCPRAGCIRALACVLAWSDWSPGVLAQYDLWTGLGISGSRAGSALSACGSRSGAGVRARVVDWSPGVLAQSGASRWACVCGNGRSRSRGRHERSRLRGLSGTRVARSLSGTRVARSARALEVARSLSGTRVARSARALEVARSLSGTRVARSARALGVARSQCLSELSKVHNAFGATVGMTCGPASLGSPGLARGLRCPRAGRVRALACVLAWSTGRRACSRSLARRAGRASAGMGDRGPAVVTSARGCAVSRARGSRGLSRARGSRGRHGRSRLRGLSRARGSRGRHGRSRLRGLSRARGSRGRHGRSGSRAQLLVCLVDRPWDLRVSREVCVVRVRVAFGRWRACSRGRTGHRACSRSLAHHHNAFGATVGMTCGPALGSPGLARGLRCPRAGRVRALACVLAWSTGRRACSRSLARRAGRASAGMGDRGPAVVTSARGCAVSRARGSRGLSRARGSRGRHGRSRLRGLSRARGSRGRHGRSRLRGLSRARGSRGRHGRSGSRATGLIGFEVLPASVSESSSRSCSYSGTSRS
ncbi:collagen alpha-1(IV) chain [Striga asiatica]|uniref:Collagen alpha-1(IV) chain n=1 Tax=Striga asiatica TaxID=4170 RepID=A0A5A7PNI8_STRAF|nr:collagen alpha-1(IV) chain [Striga asiatica]